MDRNRPSTSSRNPGKRGGRLFDSLNDQTRRRRRRHSEDDSDQDGYLDLFEVIPKEVYDDIMNRLKSTTDSDRFETYKYKLEQDLLEENDIVVIDGKSYEVLHKAKKLKPIGRKEPKGRECRTCHGWYYPPTGHLASGRYPPTRKQSDGSSMDEEESRMKKRGNDRSQSQSGSGSRSRRRPRSSSRHTC